MPFPQTSTRPSPSSGYPGSMPTPQVSSSGLTDRHTHDSQALGTFKAESARIREEGGQPARVEHARAHAAAWMVHAFAACGPHLRVDSSRAARGPTPQELEAVAALDALADAAR